MAGVQRSAVPMTSRTPPAAVLRAWLEAMAVALKAPLPVVARVRHARGVFTLTANAATVRGKASAPVSLLASVFRDAAVLATICEQPAGRWNEVVVQLRCDGAPRDRYRELLAAVRDAGARDERLGWLVASTVTDPADRSDPLFASLFPRLPAAAARVPATARSAAAFVERLLRTRPGRSPVDALIVALELYDHVGEALLEVSGMRRVRLTAALDRAVAALSVHRELAVRDIARLLRQQVAQGVVLHWEQP